jgi:dihydroorotate dehydrogenase (fumarate)
MEEYGAGAVVLHSLFENPMHQNSPHPDCYSEQIVAAKKHLGIPVIASLNATTVDGWTTLSRLIEKAGADALELNVYHVDLDPDIPSAEIESTYIEAVRVVASTVRIPVAVKLPPFFTNLARMTKALDQAGAMGLVFFNRLFQPDIDLEKVGRDFSLNLSNSTENRYPMHWISLLYRQTGMDLAASTGIGTGRDVLKMILSGASATQVCSILMRCGIAWLETIDQELRNCMAEHHFPSLKEARGLLSHVVLTEADGIELEEYRQALQGYSLLNVPTWRDEEALKVNASGE